MCSVRRFVALGPRPLQLLYRFQNAEPHPVPLRIAGLGSLVRLHGGKAGCLLPVLLDEQVGGVS